MSAFCAASCCFCRSSICFCRSAIFVSFTSTGAGGAALGIFPEWRYETGEVQLTAGDRLVLFTDGVTEAMNPQGEEFGEERLLALMTADPELGAAELQERILHAVTEFSSGDLQDDATLIVVAVNESAEGAQMRVAS